MEGLKLSTDIIKSVESNLAIIFYLLPGLITYFTYRYCRTIPKHSPFEIVLISLFFTIIDLLLFGLITLIPLSWINSVYTLYILAIFLGIVIALIENYDVPLRLLRFIRFTKKTNRLSVWNDIQKYSPDTYVRVFTNDHLMYVGFIRYYSEMVEPLEIFLTKVTVYIEDKNDYTFKEKDQIDGLYISKDRIRYIQFLDIPVKDKP